MRKTLTVLGLFIVAAVVSGCGENEESWRTKVADINFGEWREVQQNENAGPPKT